MIIVNTFVHQSRQVDGQRELRLYFEGIVHFVIVASSLHNVCELNIQNAVLLLVDEIWIL